MPDHFRQQPAANKLAVAAGHHLQAPPSPPDHHENHPLSLVVTEAKIISLTQASQQVASLVPQPAHAHHHHHHHHHHHPPTGEEEFKGDLPPAAHDHGPVHADRALVRASSANAGSPGRSVSSGFPSSPERPSSASGGTGGGDDDDAPLALVVSKPGSSVPVGLEDSGHEDGFSGGDSPAQGPTPPPVVSSDTTGAILKVRDFARAPVDGLGPPSSIPRRRSSEHHHVRFGAPDGSDAASVSSIDTWQTHSPSADAAAAAAAAAARNARANSGGAVEAHHVCRYCDRRFANKVCYMLLHFHYSCQL